jgi:outer membrane protein OmpA-like peptidoglycan-associated protein
MRLLRATPARQRRTEDDIWSTSTDLLSGLLMVFVLLVIVTLVRMGVVDSENVGEALEEARGEALRLRDVETSLRLRLQELGAELAAADVRIGDLQRETGDLATLRDEVIRLRPLENTPLLRTVERGRAAVHDAVWNALRTQHNALSLRMGGWSNIVEGRQRVLGRVESLSRSLGVMDEDLRRGAVPIPSDLLFGTNEHTISPEGELFLRDLVPRLAHELLHDRTTRGLVHRIVIEGHSSRKGRETYNMRLSALRAVAVHRFIINDLGPFTYRDDFVRLLAPTARGAIESRGTHEDEDDPRDRRVDLRVEFAALETMP